MEVRIEYVLVFMVALLLLSIWGINPSSKEATSSKGDKEVAFKNIFLADIKKDEPAQKMFAHQLVKYQNYLEMNEIELKDETGYHLLSKKAIYEEEYIYMDMGVNVLRDDGLKFTTKSLNYNMDTKEVKTAQPFLLEFNASSVKGDNLALHIDNKKITADNIEASIFFVDK